MTSASQWLLWQLADSSFPSGSFGHSGGLEAAWQHGAVSSGKLLVEFIKTQLAQVGRGALPIVLEAHREPGQFSELNQLSEAFLTNSIANCASRLLGQSFAIAVDRSFGAGLIPLLAKSGDGPGAILHFAPIFGTALNLLKIERSECARLFLFLSLRGYISSAIRLGIVGPLEGQALQFRLSTHADHVCQKCGDLPLSELAQTAPILDLYQGAHDRLYSRLFQT